MQMVIHDITALLAMVRRRHQTYHCWDFGSALALIRNVTRYAWIKIAFRGLESQLQG